MDPVELAFDKAGDLLVISYSGDGTVYSFKPEAPDDDVRMLRAEPAVPRPGMTPVLPVDYWQNENALIETESAKKPYQFISPDGTTFIPAGEKFVSGKLYYGSKLDDELRAFGMAPVVAGPPFFLNSPPGGKTHFWGGGGYGRSLKLKTFFSTQGHGLSVTPSRP